MIDLPILRALTLAKLLFNEGLRQQSVKNGLNKMIAVHHFHGATEIAMKMIMLHLGIRSEKELHITYESMLTQLSKEEKLNSIRKPLPYPSQLRILNNNRNMIQHHGQEVADATLNDAHFYSRAFLISAFNMYFDIDFESFGPIELIKANGVRGLMRVAYERYESKNMVEACALARYAFFKVLNGFNAVIPKGRSRNRQIQDLRFDLTVTKKLETIFDEIDKGISESLKYSTLLAIGIPFEDYLKISNVHANALFMMDGKVEFYHDSPISEEDAKWILSFAVEGILKLESAGSKGDIEDSFLPKMINGLSSKFSTGTEVADISKYFERDK